MMSYAFDECGAVRVCIKTDSRNTSVQDGLEKYGMIREGTLRQHMALPDGYTRDTVYFSCLDSEWPPVREFGEHVLRGIPEHS